MKKPSLEFTSFLQASGLVTYCLLIGVVFSKANTLFGPVPNVFGPALFLVIFLVSAVFCALLYLGYPFILFWEKKETKKAIRNIVYTSAWLLGFILFFLSLLLFIH